MKSITYCLLALLQNLGIQQKTCLAFVKQLLIAALFLFIVFSAVKSRRSELLNDFSKKAS